MKLNTFPLVSSLADNVLSDRISRIDRLFSQLTGDVPVSATPSYDLKQLDDEHYALTVSVPGWQEHELEVEVAGGRLSVSGRKAHSDSETEQASGGWIHRGIVRSDFHLSYSVPEHMQVTQARLQDGLLRVDLRLEVPESEKPRRIPIAHQTTEAIEHQQAG
ncbi:Hsp20 family protein [Pantoea sp. Mb-10]|uniref:Hsp20 family protein n=1 Tax=unclassified Pantoea TaxID=2630326 RepID=UPI001E3F3187|nr:MULTISPECIES: Hsp20 family protein [unclassified Pantoea]MCE0491869.1 Hsp20 family protein [Pantoea sp. Mb-10]MCE0503393.1 Hsp20 family protein [Pantoea sp. Pb-8]